MFPEWVLDFNDEQPKQNNLKLPLGFSFDSLWDLGEALSEHKRLILFKPPLYGLVYYNGSTIVGFHVAFKNLQLVIPPPYYLLFLVWLCFFALK